MAYREIVTKTIKTKSKKTFNNNYKINIENVNNVLGCWIINHKFNYTIENSSVYVIGEYDVNIWYSYENNSKTNVVIENIKYKDLMNSVDAKDEIIIKCLSQPNVLDVAINNNEVNINIEKIMGIEIIGDTSLKINVEEDLNDYQELVSENEINEDYLK